VTVRGYCDVCGRLVPIRANGWWPGDRAQKWWPVKHVKVGDDTGGADCPGMKVPL
jgi:hypothetical protein